MSAIGQPATSDSLAQQEKASKFSSQEKAGKVGSANAGYNDLDVDNFLKLLISELQNQDPLDPMKNAEMVQQIGQIREIGATDELTQTLSNLSNNQQLVTASGLMGQTVEGLADDGTAVSGTVDRVTVETDQEKETRSVKVHVGEKTMEVKNIREIQTG